MILFANATPEQKRRAKRWIKAVETFTVDRIIRRKLATIYCSNQFYSVRFQTNLDNAKTLRKGAQLRIQDSNKPNHHKYATNTKRSLPTSSANKARCSGRSTPRGRGL